jgi:hypothetical protein
MRRPILLSVASALAASALLLGACNSVDTKGQRSDGFPAPSQEMVYEASVLALREQGFVVDPDSSSPTAGVVKTRWDMSLQPFSGQGWRDQATVRIHPVPERPNHFTVEANVVREMNDNISQPSNAIMADWRTAVRVPETENVITRRIEMYFLVPDASPEFRTRYGLPAGRSARLEGLHPVEEGDPAPKRP